MTVAERTEAARQRACPRCHAEAGKKCRYRNPGDPADLGLLRPMKGVHAERLALVPVVPGPGRIEQPQRPPESRAQREGYEL